MQRNEPIRSRTFQSLTEKGFYVERKAYSPLRRFRPPEFTARCSATRYRACKLVICPVSRQPARHCNWSVIPGATVTLTDKKTNASHTVTTSGSGVYSITGLAPGPYSLTVEATGFKKQVLNNVLITSEQAQGENVQLQLGKLATQTVTVTATVAPLINTET
ncbi:MAG: carboxypeptidase-like regulatory domain-containing protein, partial [Bryobacteraceae bacterium]